MPQHEDNILPPHGPDEIDASHGYERSDVRVTGIVVFLTALAIFVAVTGILCWLAKRRMAETDLVERGRATASGKCEANHLSPACSFKTVSLNVSSPGFNLFFSCPSSRNLVAVILRVQMGI